MIQKKLPLIKSTSSFKLHIPISVESKIRHLCSVVHDVEWSGTLFYKATGSLDDGTFEATCVDLFVMDIGSSGYTEFKESADVITYRIDNDLLGEDIMEGLIHSHNNMSTFFSTTDQSTLTEEGTNANHFLSLIVNNAGTYTAGITRRVTTECKAEAHIKFTETKYYNTYGDKKIILAQDATREEDKEEIRNSEVIEWFNLEIIKEEAPNNFNDIDTRLAEIRKNKRTYTPGKYFQQTPSKPGEAGKASQIGNTVRYPAYNYSQSKYPYNGGYPNWGDDYDDDYTGSLFPNYPQSSKEEKKEEVKEVKEVKATDEFPLCLQESFDENLINQLCVQLLTGSIIVNEKSIVLEDWVKKMDAIYEKRFGLLDVDEHPTADKDIIIDNNARLESWIEAQVEFLIYTKDEALINRLNLTLADGDGLFDEADTAEICAFDMYQVLYSLPASYVKEVMMKTLETYIPNGAFDYTTFE